MPSNNPTPWQIETWAFKVDQGDGKTRLESFASILDANGRSVTQGLTVENAQLIVAAVNRTRQRRNKTSPSRSQTLNLFP